DFRLFHAPGVGQDYKIFLPLPYEFSDNCGGSSEVSSSIIEVEVLKYSSKEVIEIPSSPSNSLMGRVKKKSVTLFFFQNSTFFSPYFMSKVDKSSVASKYTTEASRRTVSGSKARLTRVSILNITRHTPSKSTTFFSPLIHLFSSST